MITFGKTSSEVISILYLDGKYYVSSGMYSSSHVTEYDEETDEFIDELKNFRLDL